MADRYWVGGTGAWSETSHWSTTSGGSSGAAVPTSADAVYINSSSGSGIIDVTMVEDTPWMVGSLSVSTGNLELLGDEGEVIASYGSVTFSVPVTLTRFYLLMIGTASRNLTTNGTSVAVMQADWFFEGLSTLYLLDDLTGPILYFDGVIYTNNHAVTLVPSDDYDSSMYLGENASGDFGTSVVTVPTLAEDYGYFSITNGSTVDMSDVTYVENLYESAKGLPKLSLSGVLGTFTGVKLPLFRVSGALAVTNYSYIVGSISIPTMSVYADMRYDIKSRTLSSALPALRIASTGGGQAIIGFPSVKLYASSSRNYLASVNKPLSTLTLASTAHVDASAWLSSALPSLEIDATGYISGNGYLSKSIAGVRLTASAIGGSLSGLSRAIPALKVSSSASWTVVSTNTLTLPAVRLYSSATNGDIVAILMNMKNFALTEYTNYNYNSIGFFNGKMVGVKADGVYELTGDTDDGSNIEWSFKTGKLDIDDGVVKKTRYVWLSYKPSGDLQLIVDDGEHEYEYDVESYKQIDNGVRVKLGKGIRNRYLQFELKNIANEKITLDRMRIFLEPTGKNR